MLISNPLISCKSHLKKLFKKRVTEKLSFSPFYIVSQGFWLPTFWGNFLQFFNRFKIGTVSILLFLVALLVKKITLLPLFG
jgi:hypothetical protein